MIKVLVFDFDGVIVRNSEFGKDKVWDHILPPEVQEDVVRAKQKISGGRGSRFDVLRDLAGVMNVKLEEVDLWIETKSKEFDNFTRAFTLQDGILPGDKNTIEILSQKYPLYVNSSTPEAVLPSIAEALNIHHFFKAMYGQQGFNSKVENLLRVSNDSKTLPEEILFIGDQDTDFKASEVFGCRFVGVMNDYNKWQTSHKLFSLISAVKDLPDFLFSIH